MKLRDLALLVGALALPSCGGSDAEPQEEPIVISPGSGSESTEEPDPAPAADGQLVVGEDACETDADCAPAACCHPSACVAAANAPDCAGTMCTADCQFGTLDCGGGCLCHEGRCAARLSEPPEMATP